MCVCRAWKKVKRPANSAARSGAACSGTTPRHPTYPAYSARASGSSCRRTAEPGPSAPHQQVTGDFPPAVEPGRHRVAGRLEPGQPDADVVAVVPEGGPQLPVQRIPRGHRLRHRPFLGHRAVGLKIAAGADGDDDRLRPGHVVPGEELGHLRLEDDARPRSCISPDDFSYTSTSQPSDRRARASNSPPSEPPTTATFGAEVNTTRPPPGRRPPRRPAARPRPAGRRPGSRRGSSPRTVRPCR